MIIEIRKAGFINKGAELMLFAILEKLKERYPDAKFAMAPNLKSQPFEKRVPLGLYQKVYFWRKGFQFGILGNLIPPNIRKEYGLVVDKEISVVIDASGFSYSDQCGTSSCLELANSCKRWKKNNTKVILLPQAFGPFESIINKSSIKKAVENIDVLYARDTVSYNYLVNTVGEKKNIKLAPDFTNLLKGIVPDNFNSADNKFCIVPNYRMIDKTSKEMSDAYIPFLIKCAKYLLEKNQKPFILVHEGDKDFELAQIIKNEINEINIIQETDPLKIKGILGACEGTIGSRFHGLVSALSQGIPSLATGWSHKYQMLFNDYGFSGGLMDVKMSDEDIKLKIDLIIEPESREAIKNKIIINSNRLKELSQQMWDEVFMVIN